MLFDLNKQINVLMFGKHSEATGYWHNGRSLTAHFLMYCIEGSLSMQVEDNTYYIEAGNSFFIPKNTFYKPLRSDGCIYYFIHFIANSPDSDNLHPDPHVNINVLDSDDDYSYNLYGEENGISIIDLPNKVNENSDDIREVFFKMSKLNLLQSRTEKLLLDNYFRKLLILLSEPSNKTYDNPLFKKILEYIDRNFKESFTLDKIAEKYNISPSYLSKLFKKYCNMGMIEYINHKRLIMSCELLCDTDLNIGEIAEQIGFRQQYYFNRLYLKEYGITPTEFRVKFQSKE